MQRSFSERKLESRKRSLENKSTFILHKKTDTELRTRPSAGTLAGFSISGGLGVQEMLLGRVDGHFSQRGRGESSSPAPRLRCNWQWRMLALRLRSKLLCAAFACEPVAGKLTSRDHLFSKVAFLPLARAQEALLPLLLILCLLLKKTDVLPPGSQHVKVR